jgi:Co/Zn/Cd efflux system component
MSDDCCQDVARELAQTAERRRILRVVLAINVVVFLAEFGVGWIARSVAVQADSLDALGDALVYVITLSVLDRSLRARAWATATKGLIQLAFGLGVLGAAVSHLVGTVAPTPALMGIAASGALAANLACFLLLFRFRDGDLNMRSVWLCSRNDVIGNAATLVVAGLVAVTGSGWPDVIVGGALAMLFLKTSWTVLRSARGPLRASG